MAGTIEINGVTFEVIKPRKWRGNRKAWLEDHGHRRLRHFYNTYSRSKRVTWDRWLDWFEGASHVGVRWLQVTGGNSQFFTIGAWYDDGAGTSGELVITRNHNRLYLMDC